MTEDQIKHMVNRFLCWKLPGNFNPDAGISFKAAFNEHTAHPMKHEPSGTNLLDATQADAMVRAMIEGMPALSPPEPTEGLRAALEPFAKIADGYARADAISEQHHKDEGRSWKPHSDAHRTSIGLGDCRRAAAALRAVPLQDHADAVSQDKRGTP